MNRRAARGGRILALVTLSAVLCGCSAEVQSAVRVAGGGLVVQYCDETKGNVIRVAAAKASETKLKTIWQAKADDIENVIQPMSLNGSIPGFSSETALDSLASFDEIEINIETHKNGELVAVRSSQFYVDQIKKKTWLRSDGSHNATACDR